MKFMAQNVPSDQGEGCFLTLPIQSYWHYTLAVKGGVFHPLPSLVKPCLPWSLSRRILVRRSSFTSPAFTRQVAASELLPKCQQGRQEGLLRAVLNGWPLLPPLARLLPPPTSLEGWNEPQILTFFPQGSKWHGGSR